MHFAFDCVRQNAREKRRESTTSQILFEAEDDFSKGYGYISSAFSFAFSQPRNAT